MDILRSIFIFLMVVIPLNVFSQQTVKPKWFDGKRITRSHSVIFNGTVEEIFPLLCPVREYEWMASWKGTTVYTDSGFAEKYVVFYHKLPFPLSGKKVYWTAAQYEPDSLIQWVVTVPGICIIIIDENMKPSGDNKTIIDYKYTITGVSKPGNIIIDKMFTQENLLKEINRSKEEIEYYLKTGEMLKTKYKSGMFD